MVRGMAGPKRMSGSTSSGNALKDETGPKPAISCPFRMRG